MARFWLTMAPAQKRKGKHEQASTFVTSIVGVITFLILSAHHRGPVAPDWPTGIGLGVGGLAGAYTGARIQRHLPDIVIRRAMGVLVVAIGARYLWSGLGCSSQPGGRQQPV